MSIVYADGQEVLEGDTYDPAGTVGGPYNEISVCKVRSLEGMEKYRAKLRARGLELMPLAEYFGKCRLVSRKTETP